VISAGQAPVRKIGPSVQICGWSWWAIHATATSRPVRNYFELSFSGDIPDPPGQGPMQPAVGDPAWAGGLD